MSADKKYFDKSWIMIYNVVSTHTDMILYRQPTYNNPLGVDTSV